MPSSKENEIDKYAHVKLQQLMNLKGRGQAMKQMGELIRIRNEI